MPFLRLTKEGSEHASEVVTNCHYLKFHGSAGLVHHAHHVHHTPHTEHTRI